MTEAIPKAAPFVLRFSYQLQLLVLFFALFTPSAHTQGCTQCRDNTAATPPATQRAYRHAITLLALSGGALFTGAVVLLKKLE